VVQNSPSNPSNPKNIPLQGELLLPLLKLENGKMEKAGLNDLAEAVYAIIQLIPPGKVTTYGSIARLLKISPRLVGYILKNNSNPIIIPCHRVIKSDGTLGGYSGPGGVDFKRRLLMLEGVEIRGWKVNENSIVDIETLILAGRD
jgi:methylated-DNA-[protein]-cysteine S-methyltransferase